MKVWEGGRCPAIGDEVHSNLWGPTPIKSINHKQYYVSFTDDHSRYTNIYFLHTKDETFNFYKVYEVWLSTQQNAKIKSLCSDRGGEYLSDKFLAHLKSVSTLRKLTIHDMPEHNGVSERLNQIIMEKVHEMLYDSDMPNSYGQKLSHMPFISKIEPGHIP